MFVMIISKENHRRELTFPSFDNKIVCGNNITNVEISLPFYIRVNNFAANCIISHLIDTR